jgi:putative transposase
MVVGEKRFNRPFIGGLAMNPEQHPTRQGYDSDVTEAEWDIIGPLLTEAQATTKGRPVEHDLRAVLNAIFYVNKTGCQWRSLPKDFPPHSVVFYHYTKWRKDGTLEIIHDVLRQLARKRAGRNPQPSGAIIDSQSVKGTPESQIESGFDGGKLIKGRKRHIVVDTMGYLLVVVVHSAGINDGKAAPEVLGKLFQVADTIRKIWADSAYVGQALHDWVLARFQCVLEVVKKQQGVKGFHVLPRRWVVERTFAWFSRARRLSKDYERDPNSSKAQVYIASIRLLLRDLCDNQIAYAA